jgi:hypothetical protein
MKLALVATSLIAASLFGCTVVCPVPQGMQLPSPPPAAPPKPPEHADARPSKSHDESREARRMYQLDFTIAGTNVGDTPPAGARFTMTLEEGRPGEIISGANIPIATGSTMRTDVGLKIRATYFMAGDDLLLDSMSEISSKEDPTGIHKLTSQGQALVRAGKPALIASVDDPRGENRYQLTVLATKLR